MIKTDFTNANNYIAYCRYEQDSFEVQHAKLTIVDIQQQLNQALDAIAVKDNKMLEDLIKVFMLIARTACNANLTILAAMEDANSD